ncbi:MAG: UvrD-helicase domain-containing protein [Nitrospinota bacterium]|nr:UvrD-helicase domain-containing protein [Nitrospinota bacterium]
MNLESSRAEEIVGFEGDTCVRASAGTGKTFILVEKFMHILKEKTDDSYTKIENILAITFTDKAAEDMRKRIGDKIYEEVRELEKRERTKEEEKLLRHLRTARRLLTKAYISTIHSFCARILRENPLEAGIDPQFEILDAQRTGALQSRSLERFLLDKLRRGDKPVAELAYRFGFDSDFAFESSLFSLVLSLLPLMRAAGVDIFSERALLSEYSEKLDDAEKMLSEQKKQCASILNGMSAEISTEKQKVIMEMLVSGISALSPSSDIGNEDTRKSVSGMKSAINLNTFKGKKDGNLKALATELKETLELYEMTVVSSLARESARQIAELVGEFYQYMESSVKNRGLLDFDDLQEMTLWLFRRNERILAYYRKMFRNVLVDEFQDVNGLQKMIVEQLAPPGEGKLFVVGDVKQAIYGFRGGDLEVFDETERAIVENGGGLFRLNVNRRSNPGLVKFVNSYFGRYEKSVFDAGDECVSMMDETEVSPVEYYTFSDEESADKRRFSEANFIASRINRLVGENKAKFSDMAILLRKFTPLPIYEAALSRNGVRYAVHRGTGFYKSQEVADLISILSFIDNPGDIVSWVGAVRSPYCGCSDRTLFTLRRDGEGKTVEPYRLFSRDAYLPPLDEGEGEKFSAFAEWVTLLINLKDRMAVSEIIETVLEKSRITGLLGAQNDGLQKVANVLKLIETARMMEQEPGFTLKNFVRHITRLYEQEERESEAVVVSEEENAVKIMTVHQSKGLEFGIVFLPDIGSSGKRGGGSAIFHKRKGLAVKYVEKETLSSHSGIVFESTKEEIEEKEKSDAKRLFYVGCTRAKDMLVLSGCPDPKKKRSEALSGLDELMEREPSLFNIVSIPVATMEEIREQRTPYDVLSAGEEPKNTELGKGGEGVAPMEPADERKEVFVDTRSLASFAKCKREYMLGRLYSVPAERSYHGGRGGRKGVYEAMEIGNAIHAILEKLDLEVPQDEMRTEIIKMAKRELPLASEAELLKVSQKLERLFKTPLFEKIRSGEMEEKGREVPFTARFGRDGDAFFLKGQVDLLLRRGETGVMIVDYKYAVRGESETTYRFQVEAYAVAAERVLGVEEIVCAIVYLGGEEPECVEWKMDTVKLQKAEEAITGSMKMISEMERSLRGTEGIPDADFSNILGESGAEIKCPDGNCGYHAVCFSGE